MLVKLLLGTIASILTVICYLPYIRNIIKHKTKPHAFSWLTWSVLAVINFAIQVTGEGGAGSWIWAVTAAETSLIFFLSYRYGEKSIKRADWICFGAAAISLILWALTKNPINSVILISLVSALGGFAPTFRKSYNHPEKETLSTYVLSVIILILSLLALETFTFTNALYPLIATILNSYLVFFLIIRRKQLAK